MTAAAPTGQTRAVPPEAARAPMQVVVQHRQRLFRDGIQGLLDATDGIEVVGTARCDNDLVALCRQHRPAVAVIEFDVAEWDVLGLLARVRRARPLLVAVGLTTASPPARRPVRTGRSGLVALVPREAGIAGIVEAITAPCRPPRLIATAYQARRADPGGATRLTSRELEVLALVGAGFTSAGVSGRLEISHKTVENHKQRIFAKLGVQNQAHAVSVAIRTGVLRAEHVLDLAAVEGPNRSSGAPQRHGAARPPAPPAPHPAEAPGPAFARRSR